MVLQVQDKEYLMFLRIIQKKLCQSQVLNTLNRKKQRISILLLLLHRFSCIRLCETPQTAAHQVPPSLGFSRQEYWSGLPFPSPKHACMVSRFSHVRLCVTPWTAAHQAPLSTEFSRQEYWSGLPFPSPISTQSVEIARR